MLRWIAASAVLLGLWSQTARAEDLPTPPSLEPAVVFWTRVYSEVDSHAGLIHDAEHLSFIQGGGHGGSHPHLVHEFVSALIENRDPWPNAVTSANWTCVGILAHESAVAGGAIKQLPAFTRMR